LGRRVNGGVLLDQPPRQFLAQVHGPVLPLGKADQLRLQLGREHPLEGLFGPLHPLLPQSLPLRRRHSLTFCHPWLLSSFRVAIA